MPEKEVFCKPPELPSSEYIVTDASASGYSNSQLISMDAENQSSSMVLEGEVRRSQADFMSGVKKLKNMLDRKGKSERLLSKENSEGSVSIDKRNGFFHDQDGNLKWVVLLKELRGAVFVLLLIALPVIIILRRNSFKSNNESLKTAVNLWKVDPDQSSLEYGPISKWSVKEVRDMSYLFYATDFNDDVSPWDVSSTTSMNSMFKMSIFNGDISSWDVGKVVDMKAMFANDKYFNQDLSSWDVSSLKNAAEMFQYCTMFNQDLSSWQTSKFESIAAMFQVTSSFNGDVSLWDTSKVTAMTGTFSDSLFNGDVSSWDTSKVVDMSFLFSGAPFNQDLIYWNVYATTSMVGMFSKSSFNQDIGSWQVSKVENMGYMFNQAQYFNQDISGWDVSAVTKKTEIFYEANYFDCTYDPFFEYYGNDAGNYNATQNYTDATCFDY
uniref:BspA family leucine-rich repeat surface protein n=1 Tax=Corethron hystrix TaxID=216773 RepID=A0A7S1FNT0_9STRA|mmetsp:Transcript_19086/g.43452  ORF Transcript_19086/g.43452 Transcript_19086/m.43452 type:complete len:438 (+) Transcript_19086:313-1626(+)